VRARQREPGCVVIERRRLPRRRCMAGLARRREPSGNVVRVRRPLKILQVAGDAGCVRQTVVVVDMAGRARHVHVRARQRKPRCVVIERRRLPRRRCMAGLARRREPSGNVVRVRRPLEILQVAGDAGCVRQAVVVVDVAGRARHAHVRARQCESRLVVIKCRRLPRRGRVAHLAGRRNAGLRVIRIGRCVEIVDMARGAVGGKVRVIVVHMAGGAGDRRVRARQWERRLAVIKCRRLPRRRRMAGLARRWEPSGNVVRVRCPLEVLQVAADAISWFSRKLPVEVTAAARHGDVCSSQRKAGDHVVVETRGGSPGAGVMACLTGLREHSLRVVGIGGALKILQVARSTVRVRQFVVAVDVAAQARRGCVRARQWEPREGVIELRIEPGIHDVALPARCRETRCNVIRVRRAPEILYVAGIALRRETLELARCGALVAGVAIHGRVRAQKRKTILVVLDRLDGDVPPPDGVALFAIRAELAAVNIGVAASAICADIGKDQLGVTLHAVDLFVHSAKRIDGLIVIELRDASNRLPARESVAILARDCDIAVRVVRDRMGRRTALCLRQGLQREQEQNDLE
jgi:hypothetical protein